MMAMASFAMTKKVVKKVITKESLTLPTIHWLDYSPGPVIGVDEVGRGCLAGAVFAAAVCLRQENLPAAALKGLQSAHWIDQLTDSKLISEKKRDELALLIAESHWVFVASASAEEIDRINILQASLLAMKRAIHGLEQKMGQPAGHLLIDGNCKIPVGAKAVEFWGPPLNPELEQTTLIKGDLRCRPISAASIVAKVTRDQLMKKLAQEYPDYGFAKHKGYSSAEHRRTIAKFGPCPIHRKSFAGVKEFVTL